MINIENTPLWRDVQRIINSGPTTAQYGYTAIITMLTPLDNPNKPIRYTPWQVTAKNLKRDYAKGYTDKLTCTLLIPLGTYARKVYPNRKNLEITLIKAPLIENTTELDFSRVINSETYTAILLDKGNSITTMQGKESNNEETLDVSDLVDINFELVNKSLLQIRAKEVGGVFRNTTMSKLLLSYLTHVSTNLKIDNNRIIKGLDLVTPNNKKHYDQIIIPHGTSLPDVTGYLHQKYGVYNAGLGSYIQNNCWYIYPLYNTDLYSKSKKTLTIIILPKSKLAEIERTYEVIGNSVNILCTSNTQFKDDSGVNQLNVGNGVRFTDSTKLLTDTVNVVNNRAIFSRSKNNNEYIFDTPDKNLNYAPMHDERITSNTFKQNTELTLTKGGMTKITWENSAPEVLIPGMQIRLIYFDNDQTKMGYGVLQGALHASVHVGIVNTKKHVTKSLLTIFTHLVKE